MPKHSAAGSHAPSLSLPAPESSAGVLHWLNPAGSQREGSPGGVVCSAEPPGAQGKQSGREWRVGLGGERRLRCTQ